MLNRPISPWTLTLEIAKDDAKWKEPWADLSSDLWDRSQKLLLPFVPLHRRPPGVGA